MSKTNKEQLQKLIADTASFFRDLNIKEKDDIAVEADTRLRLVSNNFGNKSDNWKEHQDYSQTRLFDAIARIVFFSQENNYLNNTKCFAVLCVDQKLYVADNKSLDLGQQKKISQVLKDIGSINSYFEFMEKHYSETHARFSSSVKKADNTDQLQKLKERFCDRKALSDKEDAQAKARPDDKHNIQKAIDRIEIRLNENQNFICHENNLFNILKLNDSTDKEDKKLLKTYVRQAQDFYKVKYSLENESNCYKNIFQYEYLSNDKNLHAELVATENAIKKNKSDVYIGISKLCCYMCAQALEIFNNNDNDHSNVTIKYRGGHNMYFPNWKIPEFCNESILEILATRLKSSIETNIKGFLSESDQEYISYKNPAIYHTLDFIATNSNNQTDHSNLVDTYKDSHQISSLFKLLHKVKQYPKPNYSAQQEADLSEDEDIEGKIAAISDDENLWQFKQSFWNTYNYWKIDPTNIIGMTSCQLE